MFDKLKELRRDVFSSARSGGRRFVGERAALVVAALATVWFAGVALWELTGPFAAGHYAASSAVCVGAENMWRWGILAPVTHYTEGAPSPGDYYCHHPWGIFWVTALFVKVFGSADWVCRLPAILQSMLMPPLLYATGRAFWGPVPGAVSAASFVVLPIALSFANFNALEVPVMFGCLVAAWGFARLRQTGRRRFLAISVFGFWYAANSDWAGFFYAAFVLAVMLPRGFFFERWFEAIDARRFAQWWALSAAGATLLLSGYLLVFAREGQLFQLLRQGEARASGWNQPLSSVLDSRRYWIETSFTPLAILLGKLAALLLPLRLSLLRRDAEIFVAAALFSATLQYVAFKQGADVHVFWPHTFALYFALAMGMLAASGLELGAAWLSRRGKGPALPRLELALLFVFLLPALSILPDGIRGLHYARATGGRFGEKGLFVTPDVDKREFFEWIAEKLDGDGGVQLHPGMKQSLWMDKVLRRPLRTVGSLPREPSAPGQARHYLLDARLTSASTLSHLAARFQVVLVEPFWWIDRTRPRAPLLGFRIEREAPSWFESYWVSGSHDLRRIAASPLVTWEQRLHLDQRPNPLPGERASGEELRIQHNLAVFQGDQARAERSRERLLQGAERLNVRFSDGTELVGVRVEESASTVLILYFLASGPATDAARFVVRSVVSDRPAWSWVDPDPKEYEVGAASAIPRELWRPGFVYASVTEVMKRPGRETFFGFFEGDGAPRSVDGTARVPLVSIE